MNAVDLNTVEYTIELSTLLAVFALFISVQCVMFDVSDLLIEFMFLCF